MCFPSRKPLASAAWAQGEAERVWLRDWLVLEAEPGPVLGKTTHWVGTGWRLRCLQGEVAEWGWEEVSRPRRGSSLLTQQMPAVLGKQWA